LQILKTLGFAVLHASALLDMGKLTGQDAQSRAAAARQGGELNRIVDALAQTL